MNVKLLVAIFICMHVKLVEIDDLDEHELDEDAVQVAKAVQQDGLMLLG